MRIQADMACPQN